MSTFTDNNGIPTKLNIYYCRYNGHLRKRLSKTETPVKMYQTNLNSVKKRSSNHCNSLFI